MLTCGCPLHVTRYTISSVPRLDVVAVEFAGTGVATIVETRDKIAEVTMEKRILIKALDCLRMTVIKTQAQEDGILVEQRDNYLT